MSGRRVPRDLRGFLLHDSRITFDNLEANDGSSTGSSYTQTGPGPGQAEPVDELGTYLPRAHNGQDVDLDIIALRAGAPEIGDADGSGAGLAYREDGEANTSYRGWNEPNLLMGFRTVESDTIGWNSRVDAVTCPTSQKVVAVATEGLPTLPPSSWVWAPSTRTWGSRVAVDSTLTSGRMCILVQRQTGRLLVLRIPNAGGNGAIYSSDDDGASWQEYAPAALRNNTIDASVSRLRWIEDRNGTILLVAATSSGSWWQYASTDGGANFTAVGNGTGMGQGSLSRLPSGNILFVYLTSAFSVKRRVLTDAFHLASDAAEATVYDGSVDAAESAHAVVDADGVAYALYALTGTHRVALKRSSDEAVTWDTYPDLILQYGAGMTVAGTRNVEAVACSGGDMLALVTNVYTGAPGTADTALQCLVLGGWGSIEAEDTGAGRRRQRGSWADPSTVNSSGVVLPDVKFVDLGWTATGTAESAPPAGAGSEHRFNPTAAQSYVTLTAPGHTAGDFAILFEARVLSGGSLNSDACGFFHQRRNGTNAYKLRLRFDGTGFRVRDASGAGTNLGTVPVDITLQKVQILIIYGDIDTVSVFWKRYSESVWTLGVQANLGSDATGASTDQYEIGCIDSTTSDFRVGLFAFTFRTFSRGTTTDATGGISRMGWGKPLSPLPYPVRDQADSSGRVLHLSGSGGAAKHQERWDLPASYDYGIREIDPIYSPKPTRTWRSTSTAEQILTWDLGDNSRLGHSWAIGLCLIRPNFRRAILEVSTSLAPTVFTQLGEYNSRVVVSSTFSRSGNLLEPGSAATPGVMYFGADDLRRGFVTFDPSGTPVNRKIRKNQGGGWVASGMKTALELTGIDGTEPTSGNLHVNMSGGVLVIHQSAATAYRRVRLRIPSQECPDSYFELGNIVLGSIWAVGRQWSRGWSRRFVPLIREEEDEAGTLYVEPRAEEENTYRREITLAWQDGHTISGLWMGHPDYLSAADGTSALVADHDVMHQLVGFLRASRGGAVPSVALLEIPSVTSTVIDPSLWSYGRLGVGQPAQFNNVQGSEGRSEVYRGESLTHVELRG